MNQQQITIRNTQLLKQRFEEAVHNGHQVIIQPKELANTDREDRVQFVKDYLDAKYDEIPDVLPAFLQLEHTAGHYFEPSMELDEQQCATLRGDWAIPFVVIDLDHHGREVNTWNLSDGISSIARYLDSVGIYVPTDHIIVIAK